ncbi:MAG: hypothetical protein ACXWM1_12995 [Candidatus Binataceae bacterium]
MSGDRTLLPFAENIKHALAAPEIDVPSLIASGDLRIHTGANSAFPPGFRTLLQISPEATILISAYADYRYREFSDKAALIEREIAAGRGNLLHLLRLLRGHGISDSKAAKLGAHQHHGQTLIKQPFMGHHVWTPVDMCLHFHNFVLQHFLVGHLRTDLDAVVEIGCGAGDALVDLANRSPFPNIKFFGGEIALNGLRTLARLAEMRQLDNVAGVDFDIANADFGFLAGARKILVFSQFALVYVNPFPAEFWERLLQAADEVSVMLFEPFSFALDVENPLFTRKQATNYGLAQNFWESIQALAQTGRIVIDELIPDIAGKNGNSAVSLVRFHKAAT